MGELTNPTAERCSKARRLHQLLCDANDPDVIPSPAESERRRVLQAEIDTLRAEVPILSPEELRDLA
jgi:hypothetical protein